MAVENIPAYPPFRRRADADADARRTSALNAVRAILAADLLPPHRKELLSVCLWKLSEAEGINKYETRYASSASLGRPAAELAHEHVHERRRLIDDLVEGRIEANRLAELCIGCTVLRTEHAKLTALRTGAVGWERYRQAGISVIDRHGGGWCVPPQSATI